MKIDREEAVRYFERILKHRCVRCGDQHEDGYKPEVCAACMSSSNGRDWTDDDGHNSPRTGQSQGLNALRRQP